MAEQILTNIISTIGVRCRNYAHYTSYKSCIFNIWVAIAGSLSPGRYRRVAIAGSLSVLLFDDFERKPKLSVAITSGSTVLCI